MTAKIFQNMVLVSTLVFALCVAIFMGTVYEYFENRVYDELQSEAELAVQGVTHGGENFFEGLQMTDRLTWVAPMAVSSTWAKPSRLRAADKAVKLLPGKAAT